MNPEALTSAHLDYLQHQGPGLELLALPQPLTSPSIPWSSRRLFRISGLGQHQLIAPVRQDARPIQRLESQDLVMALSGYGAPLAFLSRGSSEGVEIYVGTWGADSKTSIRGALLKTAMAAQFPEIDVSPPVEGVAGTWPVGSVALGVPSPRPSHEVEAPIDRIIRALQGKTWQALVLAEPVNALVPIRIRTSALEESREIQSLAQAERAPSPIAEHYVELLKKVILQASSGLAMGMWRCATYLLADKETHPALFGLWRGVFSGEESLPEPVSIFLSASAPALAEGWVLPELPAAAGPGKPGKYRRMLEYQTLLTSGQLAQYVQFPRIDTPGFSVRTVPRFHAAPSPIAEGSKTFVLGKICVANSIGPEYRLGVNGLVKHALVAGVTGVGKTTTVFHILKSLRSHELPFLVIEPAKREYRSMLKDPVLSKNLKIYTLGNVGVSPFTINPFEPEPETPVGVHLDLIRSVFSASFGMWTPLPQILERCLQAIYTDRGWDLISGGNARLGKGQLDSNAWPTLSDLASKIEEVIPSLGYDEKIANDMSAALLTRVTGLCRGAKGQMLDTRKASTFSHALNCSAVFELEGIADDDEKAFVIGLILIRLIEFRRCEKKTKSLRHLLVIEEAHRLLANVGEKSSEESANPRGKAVETFANLLSEIRAYGQGVLVADQIPIKLAPDVVKNTNLKIVHRIVAGDDRAMLSSSMAMDASQERGLSILRTGQAAVFCEGEDAPLLVQMEKVKALEEDWPTDAAVREHMLVQFASNESATGSVSATRNCISDATQAQVRERVKEVVADPLFRRDFARLLITLVEDSRATYSAIRETLGRANRWIPAGCDSTDFHLQLIQRAVQWFSDRRGQQREWSYEQCAAFVEVTCELLSSSLLSEQSDAEINTRFRTTALALHTRREEPFPGCDLICEKSTCLYRSGVADHIAGNPSIRRRWAESQGDTEGFPSTGILKWLVAEARHVVEPRNSRNQVAIAALCVAQHLCEFDLPDERQGTLVQLLEEASDYAQMDGDVRE